MNYKPLHIPARDRAKGEYIWCGKCNSTITTHCKQSGKKKGVCKHPEHHRFQSKVWDKSKKRTVPIKTYPKELRDYQELKKLHPIEVRKYLSKGKTTINHKRPTLLKDALKKYYDWLNDVDVPSHKAKNLSEKHIKGQLTNLITFKESEPDYDSLEVLSVTDFHVSNFHLYLEKKQYAGKTYNNKMFTLKQAFDYFTDELKYPLKNNPFEVSYKPTEAKKDFIEIDDFKTLLKSVTVESGIKFEKCSDRVKRVSLYRDWLTDFWELALYTGGRREDVVELRLDHVKEKHIEVYDFKNSKKTDVIRWVPRSKEFNMLLQNLKDKYNLKDNDYLIEPEDKRRTTISNHASKAFTHYWRGLETGYYARMYTLRDTHATLMVMLYGDQYKGVFGMHKNIKTTLDNYADYRKMIEPYADKPMFG